MRRELDERIGLAMLETAVVSLAHGLSQGLEGGAHGRSTDRVQLAADEKGSIVPDGELEPALLNRDSLLAGHALGIERMAQTHAVVPQTTGRAYSRALDEVIFNEGRFCSRLSERARRAGDHRQVREADRACGNRIGGFRESVKLLANVDAVVRRAARHLAVVPDPLARRRRVEAFRGIVGCKLRSQACRVFREFEFEAIDYVVAPLEPAGDVVIRQVLDDPLKELVHDVGDRQLGEPAPGRDGDGAHRVLQKSGDVVHSRSSSWRRARRSRFTRARSSSISRSKRWRWSSMAVTRSSSPELVFAETPPTPIFMYLIIRTYVRSVKPLRCAKRGERIPPWSPPSC